MNSPIAPQIHDLKNLSRSNIAWSWKQSLLNALETHDTLAWNNADHNLVKYLENISQESLQKIEQNKDLQKLFSQCTNELKELNHLQKIPSVAYFCMEYGLTSCLRIYSGGLGILAGDHLKTASDLRWPLCAVGLAYKNGYFTQSLNSEGRQVSLPSQNDFSKLPMELIRCADQTTPLKIQIPYPDRLVTAQAWKVGVGAVCLYLLDTHCPENSPEDQNISDSLYSGDTSHRLKQEILLGVGGYLLLKAMNITPKVYHMNEGHAAFLIWARLAELSSKLGFKEALDYCRETQIFTTHTPVPAGHDVFGDDLIRPYLELYSKKINIPFEKLSSLGKLSSHNKNTCYSVTDLALSGAANINGVSQIHGRVSREMFHEIYPHLDVNDVPVKGITNGVHVGTWLADEWQEHFTSLWGETWRSKNYTTQITAELAKVPDEALWKFRQKMKMRLLTLVKENIKTQYSKRGESSELINTTLSHLTGKELVIGFARRFATYKRATLLFHHIERLEALINKGYPITILYAGKAHPKDIGGQDLIHEVIEYSRKPSLQGRVIFLENYEMDMARLLVQGSDIWLNTPTRPLEASGTSGMKAAMNGTLNLSVDDGWWSEAANGKNGWLIADKNLDENIDFQLKHDSKQIYDLLESEIVPMFFNRQQDIPVEWIKRVKESMISTIWPFSTARMLGDYESNFLKKASTFSLPYSVNLTN